MNAAVLGQNAFGKALIHIIFGRRPIFCAGIIATL